jgi:hypothetical protein
MPTNVISQLSSEQESMISTYRHRWHEIEIEVEPTDPEKIFPLIKLSYELSNYPEPNILSFESPFMAINEVIYTDNLKAFLGRSIHLKFFNRVLENMLNNIKIQLSKELFVELSNKVLFPESLCHSVGSFQKTPFFLDDIKKSVEQQLISDLGDLDLEFSDFSYFTRNLVMPSEWAFWGCLLDFCISALHLQHDRKKWETLQKLIQYCGPMFQFENVCIISERPRQIFLNHENMLLAEGEPAIRFADGYTVYPCP